MIGESTYHRTRSFWKLLWHAWQDRRQPKTVTRYGRILTKYDWSLIALGGAIR